MENKHIDLPTSNLCVVCKTPIIERFVLEIKSDNDGRFGGSSWRTHSVKNDGHLCPTCKLLYKFPQSEQDKKSLEEMAYTILSKNQSYRFKENWGSFTKGDIVYETVELHTVIQGSRLDEPHSAPVHVSVTKEPTRNTKTFCVPTKLLEKI